MDNHPLKKTRTYLILTGVCIGIILLIIIVITIFDKLGKGENINDDFIEGIIIFICIPGILIGITGAIISAVRKK